jgi:hypothetical protein
MLATIAILELLSGKMRARFVQRVSTAPQELNYLSDVLPPCTTQAQGLEMSPTASHAQRAIIASKTIVCLVCARLAISALRSQLTQSRVGLVLTTLTNAKVNLSTAWRAPLDLIATRPASMTILDTCALLATIVQL